MGATQNSADSHLFFDESYAVIKLIAPQNDVVERRRNFIHPRSDAGRKNRGPCCQQEMPAAEHSVLLISALAWFSSKWQRSVFIFNLNDFYRYIGGVFVRMRPLPSVPQHKGRLLLFIFLHLTRVEDKFPVRVSDDYVANLLDIERTGQTMRMDWLFAVWWDCYFQHSDVLIFKDDLVSFRRCFHAIQVSGPRAYSLRAIVVLGLSRPENNH